MQPTMRARDSTGDFERHRGLCLEPWTSGDEDEGVLSVHFLCVLGGAYSSAQQLPGLRCEEMQYARNLSSCRRGVTDWAELPPAPVESRSKSHQ